jgi:hypothetical protein
MRNNVYDDWKMQISNLEEKLKSDPANLHLACTLWSCLKVSDIYDMRSGDRLISIFRNACLQSEEGIVRFAHNYKELLHDTGEAPLLDKFDR